MFKISILCIYNFFKNSLAVFLYIFKKIKMWLIMKKSVSILFCFLVMILSISAVSAADMDLDPELALPKSDVGIGASDGEVLADDGSGDFTSLQNSIDDDGSTLILTSDYKRVDGDSDVSITKDVTIIGNNHN